MQIWPENSAELVILNAREEMWRRYAVDRLVAAIRFLSAPFMAPDRSTWNTSSTE